MHQVNLDAPEGKAVAACAANLSCAYCSGGLCECAANQSCAYVAYSTSSFGSAGTLWRVDMLSGAKHAMSVDGDWGAVTKLCMHSNRIFGFGGADGVLHYNPEGARAGTTAVYALELVSISRCRSCCFSFSFMFTLFL